MNLDQSPPFVPGEIFTRATHWVTPHSNNSAVQIWLRVKVKYVPKYGVTVYSTYINSLSWSLYKIT